MYEPSDVALKVAIRYGESIREHMIAINAFDAAAAMRDLLAVAYKERQRQIDAKQHVEMDPDLNEQT